MRMARQHHAVLAKQRDRFIGAADQRPVELFEILRLDRADHQAEEFAVSSHESPGERYRPGSGAPILFRAAKLRAHGRVGLEGLEIIPIRDIEGWSGPRDGRIDHCAIGADQHHSLNMREAADLVLQHELDIAARHGTCVDLVGHNRESLHVLDQARLDQVDGLEITRRLFGQHGRGCQQLLLALHDRVIAQVGQDEGDGTYDERDQERSAQHQDDNGTRRAGPAHRRSSPLLREPRQQAFECASGQQHGSCDDRSFGKTLRLEYFGYG
jgi:hypothetical protein